MPGSRTGEARLTVGLVARALFHAWRRTARLGLAIMLAIALIGSGMTPVMAFEQGARATMAPLSMQQHSCDPTASHGKNGGASKHTARNCMSDAGCLLVIGLPTTSAPSSEHLSWAWVAYWGQPQFSQGIKAPPGLEPPRRI